MNYLRIKNPVGKLSKLKLIRKKINNVQRGIMLLEGEDGSYYITEKDADFFKLELQNLNIKLQSHNYSPKKPHMPTKHFHGKLLGFFPFYFGYKEWHHLYTGIIFCVVPFFLDLNSLLFYALQIAGGSMIIDDIYQHYRQYKNPSYRSPWHVYGMRIVNAILKPFGKQY